MDKIKQDGKIAAATLDWYNQKKNLFLKHLRSFWSIVSIANNTENEFPLPPEPPLPHPSLTPRSTQHKIDKLGSNLGTPREVREIYQSTGHIKRIS